MIVILGTFSVIQLTFLPGLIFTRLVKLQGVWENILLATTLSPVINYLFVLITTVLGIYNQCVVLIVFGIEIASLIYLSRHMLNATIEKLFSDLGITSFFQEYLSIGKSTWVNMLLIMPYFGLLLLTIFAFFYYLNGHSTFIAWDAVVSWDRWAMDWYHNHLPLTTWHYPQLIPANWSLTYQFMGVSAVKLFAKAFMAIIEVNVFLTIFIVGVIKCQSGYFIGILFTAWLQYAIGSRGNGYVDTAVAFFALSATACLILSQSSASRNKSLLIYLGAFLTAGAALTKQAGLWMAICYPFLLIFSAKKEEWRSLLGYLPGILAIYALLILPWYGFKEYQIRTGVEESEVQYVTSIASQGKSAMQTFTSAIRKLEDSLILPGKISLILLCVLTILSCKERFFRGLVGLVIIPFAFIWTFFFSYDVRNFNLVVPLIGITAGIGCQNIIDRLKTPNLKFLFSIKVAYLLVPFLGIFLLPFAYSDTDVINNSLNQQKAIGEKGLNQMLYDYEAQYGLNGKILTDYQYLGFLPGLEEYYQLGYTYDIAPDEFISELSQPEIGYALVNSDWILPEISAYITQAITDGKMKAIFEYGTYLFVTTCRGTCKP